MGSEIVFELYRKRSGSGGGYPTHTHTPTPQNATVSESESGYYVRVLFGGQTLRSSNPSLGLLDMVPVETLLAYFDGLVGKDASLVKGKCAGS